MESGGKCLLVFPAEAAVWKCCVVHSGGTPVDMLCSGSIFYSRRPFCYLKCVSSAMFTAWPKMLQGCTDMWPTMFICVLVRERPIRPKQRCHLPSSHPHPVALCARLFLFFQRRWILRCGRVLPEQYLPQTLHRVSILPPPSLCYQDCINKILLRANKV